MRSLRYTAAVVAGLVFAGVAGCGPTANSQSGNGGSYSQSPTPMRQPQQPAQGMSTKQKVLLVAGAAALYYLYNKHKNAQGTGAQGQYYRSKNGRIYYRDKNGQPVWVTEPSQPMQIPADEYQRVTGQSVGNNNGGVIRDAPAGW